jgi:hypothetical protein
MPLGSGIFTKTALYTSQGGPLIPGALGSGDDFWLEDSRRWLPYRQQAALSEKISWLMAALCSSLLL